MPKRFGGRRLSAAEREVHWQEAAAQGAAVVQQGIAFAAAHPNIHVRVDVAVRRASRPFSGENLPRPVREAGGQGAANLSLRDCTFSFVMLSPVRLNCA
jgi:hypothetical protein